MHFLNLLLNCLTFDIRLIERRRARRERKKILQAERLHFVLSNIHEEIADDPPDIQAKIITHTLRYFDEFQKTVVNDERRMRETISGEVNSTKSAPAKFRAIKNSRYQPMAICKNGAKRQNNALSTRSTRSTRSRACHSAKSNPSRNCELLSFKSAPVVRFAKEISALSISKKSSTSRAPIFHCDQSTITQSGKKSKNLVLKQVLFQQESNVENNTEEQQNENQPNNEPTNQTQKSAFSRQKTLKPHQLRYIENNIDDQKKIEAMLKKLKLARGGDDSSLFSADGKSTDIFDDSEGGGSVINPEDDEEYYEYGVIKEGDMMDDMGGYDENKKYSTDDEYEGKY